MKRRGSFRSSFRRRKKELLWSQQQLQVGVTINNTATSIVLLAQTDWTRTAGTSEEKGAVLLRTVCSFTLSPLWDDSIGQQQMTYQYFIIKDDQDVTALSPAAIANYSHVDILHFGQGHFNTRIITAAGEHVNGPKDHYDLDLKVKRKLTNDSVVRLVISLQEPSRNMRLSISARCLIQLP